MCDLSRPGIEFYSCMCACRFEGGGRVGGGEGRGGEEGVCMFTHWEERSQLKVVSHLCPVSS